MLIELGTDNLHKAYAMAAKELRRHPLRVYNKDRLLEVKAIGPATANVSPSPPLDAPHAHPTLAPLPRNTLPLQQPRLTQRLRVTDDSRGRGRGGGEEIREVSFLVHPTHKPIPFQVGLQTKKVA